MDLDEEYTEVEESVYDEETRTDMVDDDSISAEEAAFMKGYDDAEKVESKKEEEPEDESFKS